MQRKKSKRSLQVIRRGHAARSKKGQVTLREQTTEVSSIQKVIASGLFALKLGNKHGLDIFPKIGVWSKSNTAKKILSDIYPVYRKVMEILGVEPLELENDAFFPAKLLEDINQHMLNYLSMTGYEPIAMFEEPDGHKLFYLEHLDTPETLSIFVYEDVRELISGKYVTLYHRALKSLLWGCGINDWNDIYYNHYNEMIWEEIYQDEDSEASKEIKKLKRRYEHGAPNKAINSIRDGKELTSDYLERFKGDAHPLVGFAKDVLDLSAIGETTGIYSRQHYDDGFDSYTLSFTAQFVVAYQIDDVFDYFEEYVNNIADNDGVEAPVKKHLLTEDMDSIPESGQDSFPFRLRKLFDDWGDLRNLIKSYQPKAQLKGKSKKKQKTLLDIILD